MDSFDLLVIGGGINGTAIARDAAIRGAKVLLVEKDDLAQHTSSASSKLIHGGLRYLEQYEFRLVREALHERGILLRTAPHIVRPLSFVLPHARGMRPWWMLRAGLAFYDAFALRGGLPRARSIGRREPRYRQPLRPERQAERMALYWDAWVDDARLVLLNAMAAADEGAEIATRTELLSAKREGEAWLAELSGARTVTAKAIVNAAGPWVAEVLGQRLGQQSRSGVRLIKGSHIVVPRLYDGDHAYILQQSDGRVVFALPYGEYTLIGTTDLPVERPEDARISAEESAYLCDAVNLYFKRETRPEDVVWSYAGVRSLFDNGAERAQQITRDYRLELDDGPGPKLLSVFGGKITTARALAEEALDKLGLDGRKRTAWLSLPGGDLTPAFNGILDEIASWLPAPLLLRLSRAYGTRLGHLLKAASSLADLGRHFGAGLYEAEVRYLVAHEYARTADDILWRRTKLGLRMSSEEKRRLERWLASAYPQLSSSD